MLQRLLTKYGAVLHGATLCLLPVTLLFGGVEWLGCALLWVAWATVVWSMMLPSARRGEGYRDARRRVATNVLWDPLLYFGLMMLLFIATQTLNSGCELEYLPDADVWKMSDPPVVWLPFSVAAAASKMQLILYTTLLVLVLTLRHAVGRGAKRLFLQVVVAVGGVVAWLAVGLAQSGVAPWSALVVGKVVSQAGTLFAMWFLLSLGVWAESLPSKSRGSWILLICGVLGNLVGTLFFAPPIVLLAALVVAVLQFIFLLCYLPRRISEGRLLLIVAGCVVVVGSVVGATVLNPKHPVVERSIAALPLTDYWNKLSHNNEMRLDAALKIWQDYLWQGVGHDGYRHFAGTVFEADAWRVLGGERTNVHNDGVQLLLEYGLIGVILMLGGIVVFLVPVGDRLHKLRVSQKEGSKDWYLLQLSPVAISCGCALIMGTAVGFIGSPFRAPIVLFSWAAMLAIVPVFIPESVNE